MTIAIGFQYGVPSDLGAEEAASFVGDRIDALKTAGLLDADVVVSFDPGPEGTEGEPFTLEDQLERFASYWPPREQFLRAIHTGLVKLGYQPILPEIRSAATKTPASYIRYVDPINAQTLGSLNSGAFLFVGAKAKERLQGEEFVAESRDGMRIQFENQDRADFILETAKEFKA